MVTQSEDYTAIGYVARMVHYKLPSSFHILAAVVLLCGVFTGKKHYIAYTQDSCMDLNFTAKILVRGC